MSLANKKLHSVADKRSLDKIKWEGGDLFVYQVIETSLIDIILYLLKI